jgi:hypothetical protein
MRSLQLLRYTESFIFQYILVSKSYGFDGPELTYRCCHKVSETDQFITF